MNLLFYVPSMAPYGGIERHLCGLAASAAAHGHTVRLLTTGNSLGPDLRRELQHLNITFRELPSSRESVGRIRKLIWLFKELRLCRQQSWDAIYTNAQSGLARFVWRAAGANTRIIHHHHTSADAVEQTTWSRAYRRLLRSAPHLVGCSEATCTALLIAVGRQRAHFLPYLAARPMTLEEVVERAAAPVLRFGFCGRLIPEKGLEAIFALSAQPELADIEWHVHGAGAAYPPERFAGLARIVYHGAYHSAQAQHEIFRSLDAAVLFSTHNEGMPLSLIEAMSAGLPWIATDRGGTRELALSHFDSVVVPDGSDFVTLTRAVRLLADRIHAGITSRRRQRDYYEAHFAPAPVAARWLAFFQK